MNTVPMRYELHTLFEHLRDEAKKDRECGWPKKAEKKEQAAALLVGIANPTRPPCTVCGVPHEKHGSYPTCASHHYTDGAPVAEVHDYPACAIFRGGQRCTCVYQDPSDDVSRSAA